MSDATEPTPTAPAPQQSGYGRPWATARGHYVYSDDRGIRWQVELNRRTGDHPLLGFEPCPRALVASGAVRLWPSWGLEMRYINVVNREFDLRRRVPVGKLSAPILSGPAPHMVELFDRHERRDLPFTVSSVIGEKRKGMA
jgi:hypothetical protein